MDEQRGPAQRQWHGGKAFRRRRHKVAADKHQCTNGCVAAGLEKACCRADAGPEIASYTESRRNDQESGPIQMTLKNSANPSLRFAGLGTHWPGAGFLKRIARIGPALCVLILGLLGAASLQSQLATVRLDPTLGQIDLSACTHMLEDLDAKLGLAEVQGPSNAGRFHLGSPRIGLSTFAHWLRFSLQNTSGKTAVWWLDSGSRTLQEIALFSPGESGICQRQSASSTRPFADRPGRRLHLQFYTAAARRRMSFDLQISVLVRMSPNARPFKLHGDFTETGTSHNSMKRLDFEQPQPRRQGARHGNSS